MKLLDKVAAARRQSGRKGFSQPPFWSLDANRWAFLPATMPDRERIENNFAAYIDAAYKGDGIVFACILARLRVFTQIRFAWQSFNDEGRPSALTRTDDLALLENPGPSTTTGNLLGQMEVDGSLAGNYYATTCDDRGKLGAAATGPGRRIVRMQPDRVTLVIDAPSGDPNGLDARVVAYMYEPPGFAPGGKTVVLLPSEVCHYAPIPDPAARFRGMSWLTPILREIDADRAATNHKLKFFENGATLNTVVKFDKEIQKEQFEYFVGKFKETHRGTDNAYETLFLGGGADVHVVGADLKQVDFKAVQAAGEVRVAAAAGVHPVIVGISEGLAGSSLNSGNYSAARRVFVDSTMRFLWAEACASLATLLSAPPDGNRLWYDDRDIPFLREDERDAAEIAFRRAQTIRTLTDAGYTAESSVASVIADDFTMLQHSGLYSVQLLPPNALGQTDNSIDEMAAKDLVNAAGVLIRAGFTPDASLAALGLPSIDHTGLLPVTLAGAEPGRSNNNTMDLDEGVQ